MEKLKKMIFSLAGANGTPGDEREIQNVIKKYLPDGMSSENDKSGNLIATLKGDNRTVLLDAHSDRIGLVVTAIEDGGFLRVAKCGGMDARVLAAQDVTVWGKEPVYGVITSTPPHLSADGDGKKAVDFDKILVDVAMDKESCLELISLGDRITVRCPSGEMLNDRIFGAALDDRAGCAVIIRAAEIISQNETHPTVKLLFSGQEETGGDGAVMGSFNLDADECIAVDVSFADAPDMPSKKCGTLGKGPMIGVSPVLDYGISTKLQQIAEDSNLVYQLEIMSDSTGTNADHIAISKGGVRTGLVSIPLRNMHTGVEIVDVKDIEACAQLIANYVIGGGIDA